jgi:serine/threonine protein kinase
MASALLPCAHCHCHAKSTEVTCPSCGAPLRRTDGSVPRSAVAVLLGLTAAGALAGSCGARSDLADGSSRVGGSCRPPRMVGWSIPMAHLFRPGDGLGGYRIARLLGVGGFAEVYEAVDRAGVHRALKVLNAAPSRRMKAGLAREAEALVRIEHLNVVRIYEAGIEEEYVYLVLEMVDGVTLGNKLGDPSALPLMEDAVRWIHQACDGVAAAHRVGVIHRDLKPANILVTPAGAVKVIDFGIAKLKRWAATSVGAIVGTALYMAPEQLQGGTLDARADVYSMAVILYEALSGMHPLGFENEAPSMFQVFQQHLMGEQRPIRDVAPDVPADLAALVDEALARDPERRTPSMRALADGLYCVLGEMARSQRATARVGRASGSGIGAMSRGST